MVINEINTDSRSIKEGDLFTAIKGELFDGHDYVADAIQKGACGAIVKSGFKMTDEMKQMNLFVEVDDTLEAYQDIAEYNRRISGAKVVAITGSTGKTTTREMLRNILTANEAAYVVSEKNYNNHIGLPMTLLDIRAEHKIAVVEIGINQVGEMERLAEITKPDIALVTNAGSSHLEFLKNVDTVAQEKMKIADGLKEGGTLIINGDDLRLVRNAKEKNVNIVTFGFSKTADVMGESFEDINLSESILKVILKVKTIDDSALNINLKINGKHNAYNALSAIAVARLLKVPVNDIVNGLQSFYPKDMRCENVFLNKDIVVINDAYNANPDSMTASLSFFKELKSGKRKIIILGDMFELGEYSVRAHKEIGAIASNYKFDLLFFYGDEMKEAAKSAVFCGTEKRNIYWFNDRDDLSKALYERIEAGDLIMIKGSRLNKLEIIVEKLIEKIGVKDKLTHR